MDIRLMSKKPEELMTPEELGDVKKLSEADLDADFDSFMETE